MHPEHSGVIRTQTGESSFPCKALISSCRLYKDLGGGMCGGGGGVWCPMSLGFLRNRTQLGELRLKDGSAKPHQPLSIFS